MVYDTYTGKLEGKRGEYPQQSTYLVRRQTGKYRRVAVNQGGRFTVGWTQGLCLKARRCPKSPRIIFDLEKLKDPEVAEIFQTHVGGKCAALSLLDSNVDTHASNIKEVPLTTAEVVLGRQRKKTQPWLTNVVLDLCDKRQELRGRKHQVKRHGQSTSGCTERSGSQREVDRGAMYCH